MRAFLRYFLPVLLVISACNKQKPRDYTHAPEGYAYKLLALGDGPSIGAASGLVCEALIRTERDSVFFNSRYHAPKGFFIWFQNFSPASGKAQLAKTAVGDSLSLMIGKTCFFREYLDTLVPWFLAHDSMVKLDIRVLHELIAPPASLRQAPEGTEDRELYELKEIAAYLKKNYPGVQADKEGLYTLEYTSTQSERAEPGKRVRVVYNGFYLDGTPLDHGRQELEFSFGTPDQLIRGLNIVIGRLKKGETTKIIVPSRLAFGETGSTNGSVPPYTPLLYYVTLIDIK